MSSILKVVNLEIRLDKWNDGLLWDFLEWKFNQFTSKLCLENQEDILISNCLGNNVQAELSIDKIVMKEDAGFFEWRIYNLKDRQTAWLLVRRKSGKIFLKYLVNKEWNSIRLLEDNTDTSGFIAFEYLGKIMPSIFLKHSVLSFHGVLMEYQNQGIIISAQSGTGKTTHARLWRDHKNALIINGDRAVCKNVEGSWRGYGTPWSGTSGEQINRSVPIKALVVLERAEENSAEVITGLEAFGAMFPHVLYPSWDAELTGKAMDLVDDFLQSIPIIRLRCRPDVEAVETLHQLLEEL